VLTVGSFATILFGVNNITVTRMTLPENRPTRKQRFNAALSLAGLSLEQWRTEHYVVSGHHLNAVLNGEREASAELNAAIDGLIQKYLPRDAA
jgi:hypothetical protein